MRGSDGAIPTGHVVRHLNGIKDDNRPENLVLGTTQENTMDHNMARLRAMFWREQAATYLREIETLKQEIKVLQEAGAADSGASPESAPDGAIKDTDDLRNRGEIEGGYAMTKQRTAGEIRAYCEAATKGPWRVHYGKGIPAVMARRVIISEICPFTGQGEADGRFSANARADLPRALEAATGLYKVAMWLGAQGGRKLTEHEAFELSSYLNSLAWLAEEGADGST